MKTILTAFSGACALTALLLGCKAKEDVPTDSKQPAANHQRQPTIASKQDLQRLLTPGMGTNEITLALGEPRWVDTLSSSDQVWHVSLPPFVEHVDAQGTPSIYVIGVVIGITNGHLAHWGCVSGGVPIERQVRSEYLRSASKGVTNSPTLELFVVRSDPIDGGRFIDTERFPKLGFIERTPTLAIRRLQQMALAEQVPLQGQGRTNWSFNIVLTREDAAKLEALTATNISNKLLIMVGNEAVSAPRIIMPLQSGSFGIECQDRSLMQSVKKQLEEMERERQ